MLTGVVLALHVGHAHVNSSAAHAPTRRDGRQPQPVSSTSTRVRTRACPTVELASQEQADSATRSSVHRSGIRSSLVWRVRRRPCQEPPPSGSPDAGSIRPRCRFAIVLASVPCLETGATGARPSRESDQQPSPLPLTEVKQSLRPGVHARRRTQAAATRCPCGCGTDLDSCREADRGLLVHADAW
jgi:hypothetical protein